jgi:pimeloyl-ACP methyl ester carboxylesterase
MTKASPASVSLSGLNVFDHLSAGALMVATPEFFQLRKIRASNGYDRDKPTFSTPNPMPFEMVEVAGQQARIARHANPGKPLVMLLTPLPQSILAFAPIWPVLAEHFELFAYDLPGFGRSSGGAEFMTFKAQGTFLKAVIDHFGLADMHIVAPDVGMPAAVYYTGTFETSVRSLIIGDGPAIAPSTNGSLIGKLGFSRLWPLIIGNVGPGALVEAGNQIGYTTYVPNTAEIADYKASYRGRMKTVLDWFRNYPDSLATVDPLLDGLQTPTLVFWGGEDKILPVDNGIRLVERLPNSRLNVFSGAGHFSYQDAHASFAKMVIDWISGGCRP